MSAAADELQVVTPGLLFWQAYDPAVKAELSACAVRAERGWVLVDPIPLSRGAMREFGEACEGEAPAAVVLTNSNHARAAADWRARTGAPVLAHPEAALELELPLDGELADGQLVGGDLQVLALPGAGAGEIALWHGGAQSLHLGDAVIHMAGHPFGLLPDKYCRDSKALRASAQKLLQLPAEVLTFAHGLPLVSGARGRLAALLA